MMVPWMPTAWTAWQCWKSCAENKRIAMRKISALRFLYLKGAVKVLIELFQKFVGSKGETLGAHRNGRISFSEKRSKGLN